MPNRPFRCDLTAEQVREILSYDPETGLLTWKVRTSNRMRIGQVAGTVGKHGYVTISIRYKKYTAQRIIWLIVTGKWPEGMIDHRDTVRSNNRWENLREASQSQNACNSKTPSDNASGVKGVAYNKRDRNWMAYINKDGRRVYLGTYPDKAQAAAARNRAAPKYHGDFARSA